MSVRPAKTQISLGIRQVWSESSLCAQWVAKGPRFLHADNEDSDQTGPKTNRKRKNNDNKNISQQKHRIGTIDNKLLGWRGDLNRFYARATIALGSFVVYYKYTKHL